MIFLQAVNMCCYQLVNKEVALAYGKTGYSQMGNPSKDTGRKAELEKVLPAAGGARCNGTQLTLGYKRHENKVGFQNNAKTKSEEQLSNVGECRERERFLYRLVYQAQRGRHSQRHLGDSLTCWQKINAKLHDGVCQRCKEVLEWRVKYSKYKPLSKPKK
ncbi:hypothetical protein STEG23_023193, partial [Scotinomys teguina]